MFNPLRAYTRFRTKTDNTTTSPPISIMNGIVSTVDDSEAKKLFEKADEIQQDLRRILVDLEKDVDKHCEVTVPSPNEKVLDSIKNTLSTSRVKRREKAIVDKK